ATFFSGAAAGGAQPGGAAVGGGGAGADGGGAGWASAAPPNINPIPKNTIPLRANAPTLPGKINERISFPPWLSWFGGAARARADRQAWSGRRDRGARPTRSCAACGARSFPTASWAARRPRGSGRAWRWRQSPGAHAL